MNIRSIVSLAKPAGGNLDYLPGKTDRLPDAQSWVIRIGYRAVRRFGARSLKDALLKINFVPALMLSLNVVCAGLKFLDRV
jgi:hypothetical protein